MNNLWIYDKNQRRSTPQAMISLYVTSAAIIAVFTFFGIFVAAKSAYGSVPRPLTILSFFVIIGVPTAVVLWSYLINSNPKSMIRAYPVYLDEDGDLWLFDYNCAAFEHYYDEKVHPNPEDCRRESRFGGTHKERTVEYCFANEAVKEIILNSPYDSYAHRIVGVGKILEKGQYLQVEMMCRSDVTNAEYPATMVFPMDMTDLDGLRAALESKVQPGGFVQKKEYSEPGLLRIQSIESDDDKGAVVSGRMLEGTIARGDKVRYSDANNKTIFECKAAHIYREGREIVWATPVEDDGDDVYEFHLRGRTGSEFTVGNYLQSSKRITE